VDRQSSGTRNGSGSASKWREWRDTGLQGADISTRPCGTSKQPLVGLSETRSPVTSSLRNQQILTNFERSITPRPPRSYRLIPVQLYHVRNPQCTPQLPSPMRRHLRIGIKHYLHTTCHVCSSERGHREFGKLYSHSPSNTSDSFNQCIKIQVYADF